jgi:hypothetical protein
MTTAHVAPNIASAASIRAALDAAGDGAAEVIEFRDDLSCGPIEDMNSRLDWWRTTFTGDMGISRTHLRGSAAEEAHQLDAVDRGARLIVWFGHASAQEYACYLSVAEQLHGRPLHVIDVAAPRNGVDPVDAASAAVPDQLGRYLGSERLLPDSERAELAHQWSALRARNAPLRVVSAAELVSVPIDHFDDALLTHIHADPRPMTAVIADTMSDHRFQVGDWMLQQRIITLIAATKVVAVGDPSIARSCLIRRAQ